jgi:hypothetical protein
MSDTFEEALKRRKPGYWNDKNNRKSFLLLLEEKLGIKKPIDWYKIKKTDLESKKIGFSTGGFFDYYNSLKSALKDLTDYKLLDWKFHSVGKWEFPDSSEQYKIKYENFKNKLEQKEEITEEDKPTFRLFFDNIWKEEKIKDYKDLYNITQDIIIKKYEGGGIISSSNMTYQKLISIAYPEYKFYNFLFCTNAERGHWDKIDNCKEALLYYYDYNNFNSMECFYSVSRKMLDSFGLSRPIEKYGNVFKLLNNCFPEFNWDKDKFKRRDWSYCEDVKAVIYKIMISNNWCIEDLYNISQDFMIEKGYSGLMTKYNGSILYLLQDIFPDIKWYAFLFQRTPSFYWDNIENRKEAIEWLCNKIGCSCDEYGFYDLQAKNFKENNLGGLYGKYGSNIINLIKNTYPDVKLKHYKFLFARKWLIEMNGSLNISNLKEYIKDFEKENYIINKEDWYDISRHSLTCGIFNYFDNLINLLDAVYPDYNWDITKFKKVIWNDIDKTEIYKHVHNLGIKLGYKCNSDWYNITCKLVMDNMDNNLFGSYYDHSPIRMLRDVYPNFEWNEWEFGMAPLHTWEDPENHIKYFKWLYNKLNYKTYDDFYIITYETIYLYKGAGVLSKYNNSIYTFLKTVCPEHGWDKKKFKCNSYSKSCIEWLNYIEKITSITIQNKLTEEGEFIIKTEYNKWKADGYYKAKNNEELLRIIKILKKKFNVHFKQNSLEIIFEFHGDFWHGNPNVLKKDGTKKYNENLVNRVNGKTFKELYKATIDREENIKQDYNLISIWENDWKKYRIQNNLNKKNRFTDKDQEQKKEIVIKFIEV